MSIACGARTHYYAHLGERLQIASVIHSGECVMAVTVTTDGQPCDIVDGTQVETLMRAEFDYIDWHAIDEGTASASFFEYQGTLHDLGEFSPDFGITKGSGLPAHLSEWHAYRSDDAFSAMVVRYVDDYDRVIVGLVTS